MATIRVYKTNSTFVKISGLIEGLSNSDRDISGHRKLLLALLATRNSSRCLIGKRREEKKLVKQKKTLKLSKSFRLI